MNKTVCLHTFIPIPQTLHGSGSLFQPDAQCTSVAHFHLSMFEHAHKYTYTNPSIHCCLWIVHIGIHRTKAQLQKTHFLDDRPLPTVLRVEPWKQRTANAAANCDDDDDDDGGRMQHIGSICVMLVGPCQCELRQSWWMHRIAVHRGRLLGFTV